MFNSGFRGRRENDGQGSINPQAKYVQTKSPQPYISGWSISGSDDAALNPAGGQTVLVNGSGFATGISATLGGVQIGSVTLVNPTQISFTAPANSGGSYTLIVYNSSGGAAILVPGLTYSSVPTWTTAAGSIGTYYETTPISSNVVATSDSALTYSLSSGSLPSGATLYANGVITGTAPVDNSSTTYTFNITATDAELQDVTRTFTMTINVDVVTWVSPTNGTTYTTSANAAISNVSLSATDAAGYGIVYTADALPTGVSLSGNVISGTPTAGGNTTTLLTATANTTSRTATNTIYWVVQLGDTYWNLTTLALNSLPVTTPFQSDASLNNASITVTGDTRATNYNPYQTGYYSNYFDGTGDYLTVPYSSSLTFGSGNFTVECWIYNTRTTLSGAAIIGGIWDGASTTPQSWYMYLNTSKQVVFMIDVATTDTTIFTSATAVADNTWTHVAVTRSGNVWAMFYNGVMVASTTNSSSMSAGTAPLYIGSYQNKVGGDLTWQGYISNFRVVKGTAVYTTAFAPITTPLVATSATTLLTCQSYRLIDTSPNNFTVTKNGDTTAVPFNPFATVYDYGTTYYSTYFDGTGDYLTVPSNAAFAFGTGDFTIEFWVRMAAAQTSNIFDMRSTATQITPVIYLNSSVPVYYVNASLRITAGTTLTAGQWYHIAVCRSGTSTKMFIDGTQTGSTYTDTNTYVADQIGIGAYVPTAGSPFSGQISNVRVVKGTALYTTTFTPSTTPLTAVSGTSLLTCQSATTIDNSTNAFSITSTGQAQPQPVSPFTTTNYTTASTTIPTYGSGYFDGTGDYLNAGTSGAYALGTSAYTVEFWVYHTSLSTVQVYYTTQTTGGLQVWYDTTSGLSVGKYGSSPVITSGLNYVVINQWNHIAVSRVSTSASSTRIFVNGVAVATGTDSNDYGTISGPLYIGSQSTGNGVAGYISNMRMVKGTALYTANFYPSPTPLTAVSNTQLLTVQYNGGSNDSQFVDTSNLQTLVTRAGNTTQGTVSPFSATGWSAYFDGSGDYLTFPSSSAFTLGTGDFTIEAWIYPMSSSGTQGVLACADTGGSGDLTFFYNLTSGKVTLNAYGGTAAVSTASVPLNTWTYVAFSRASGSLKTFLNGTLDNTTAFTGNFTKTAFVIGRSYSTLNQEYFTGYVSNVRVTKGQALYTATFTPTTSPLTTTSQSATAGNVSILTLQSPTFIDNSANRFTISVAGDTKTQSFSPFGPVTVTPYYSTYFDGTGDYFSVPWNPALTFAANNFTVECWVYNTRTTLSGAALIGGIWDSTSTNPQSWYMYLNTSKQAVFIIDVAGTDTTIFTSSSAVSDNTWTHIAVTRSSNSWTMFFNGTVVATATNSSTMSAGTAPLYIGTYQNKSGSDLTWQGYISNFRITNGLAVYTGAFTTPTAPLAATQSSGTNISAITQASYSVYFDGTGDYLSVPYSSALNISTGNFTIECWAWTNGGIWFSTYASSGVGLSITGSVYYISSNGSTWDVASGVSIGSWTNYQWNHFALVRNGNVFTPYVNGVAGTTTTSSATISLNSQAFCIGNNGQGFTGPIGYTSNFRITKGQALYTSNFTPSTSPLTTTSQGATAANVALLTCQSSIFSDNSTNSPNTITVNGNTIISGSNPFSGSTVLLTSQSSTMIDNSVNAFAVTVAGDVRPTTIAPFAPTITTGVSYTTGVNGGSMYFDGTGDYLTFPFNTPAFLLGASDFTIEAWIYPTTYSGTSQLLWSGQSDLATTSGSGFGMYIASSTTTDFYVSSTTVSVTSPNPVKNQWSHVAVVRYGQSLKTYLNGVQVGYNTFASPTSAVNNGTQTYLPSIGAFSQGSNPFAGYMSNLRFTKNAVYTTPFVPPVTPNTNTAFTTLTTAGTNGSIIDYTGKNDLETVADARLAPQNPYGGSYYSNYFDGSLDYLTLPSNAAFGFGTGDFTIEAWVYLAASGAANGYVLFDMRSAGGTEVRPSIGVNSSSVVYYWTQATTKITGGTLTTGQWTHLAVTRASGSTKLFLNGTQSGSTYSDSTDYGSTNRIVIGNTADFPASYNASWNGYVSNFRVVKGQALYTGTFTPSTSPLTTTSQSATAGNVSLLTCQSNTFKDNSNNAFTVTATGSTVNSMNPWQNNGTYSMYFDGTGDYLTLATNPALDFNTGDFTVEAWVYPNSLAADWFIISATGTGGLFVGYATGFGFGWGRTGTAWDYRPGVLTTGNWQYIAVTRSGTSMRVFINGTQAGTTQTLSTAYNLGTTSTTIGSQGANYYLNGYITDLRVTKGYARYTTTFTPPTSTFQTK